MRFNVEFSGKPSRILDNVSAAVLLYTRPCYRNCSTLRYFLPPRSGKKKNPKFTFLSEK